MAIALPIADTVESPLTFHGVKLPELIASRPTVDMMTSGTNLMTDVHSCTAPMFFTPVRLIAAGIHSPTSAMTIDHTVAWPLLTNFST